MTTAESLAFRSVIGRHRRPLPRWLAALRLLVIAVAVYTAHAYVVGPFLVDLIGLTGARVVSVLAIAVLLWRR